MRKMQRHKSDRTFVLFGQVEITGNFNFQIHNCFLLVLRGTGLKLDVETKAVVAKFFSC